MKSNKHSQKQKQKSLYQIHSKTKLLPLEKVTCKLSMLTSLCCITTGLTFKKILSATLPECNVLLGLPKCSFFVFFSIQNESLCHNFLLLFINNIYSYLFYLVWNLHHLILIYMYMIFYSI